MVAPNSLMESLGGVTVVDGQYPGGVPRVV